MCQLLPILVLKVRQKAAAKSHACLQAFLPFTFSTDWDRTAMMTTMIMMMMMIIIVVVIIIIIIR